MQIQKFADVLICDQAWEIQACSATLRLRQMGEQQDRAEEVVGQSLAQCFGRQFAHDARGWGQSLAVSGHPFKSFTYAYHDQLFDVTCMGGRQGYCLVLEPSADRPSFAPDALVRRLLQRARGLANRQQALDTATKVLRLALRADSVSVLQAWPGESAVPIARDAKPGLASEAREVIPVVRNELLQEIGIVMDANATGSSMFGDARALSHCLPTWVCQPSNELLAFLGDNGFGSAHWYVGSSVHGARCCLLVEHQATGATDAAKRHATELAFEVLMLILDAEYSDTVQPGAIANLRG